MQRILLSDKDDPVWLYEQGQRIAKALDRGETALAQIYCLRIPVRDLDGQQLKQLAAIATHTKAGFNPAEPRVPKGDHGGGRWTSGGAGSAVDLRAHLIEAGYQLPPGMWPVVRELFRQFMAHRGDLTELRSYLTDHGLNLDELPSVVRSLFDAPKPLADLQTGKPPRGFDSANQLKAYLGDPPPGYEWHHIIEQNGQTRDDLTSPEGIRNWIQNTDNVVMIPVIKHYCINGFMSSTFPRGSGIILRNTVRSMEPKDQRQMGIILLKLCRVVK